VYYGVCFVIFYILREKASLLVFGFTSLMPFKPHVWQKQVCAGRNPTNSSGESIREE